MSKLLLPDTLIFPAEIITRRTAVAHTRHADGTVTVDAGRLVVSTSATPSTVKVLGGSDEVTRHPLGLVTGDRDPFVIAGGPGKGMRGYVSRDADGMHFGGRLASRVRSVAVPDPEDARVPGQNVARRSEVADLATGQRLLVLVRRHSQAA